MHEAVHQDRPTGAEIPAINIAVALQPRRRHVIEARARRVKKLEGLPLVILVRDLGELVIDPVHLISNPVIAHAEAVRLPIWIQHAEIVVERTVFQDVENDVPQIRHACGGAYSNRECFAEGNTVQVGCSDRQIMSPGRKIRKICIQSLRVRLIN